MDIRGLGEAVVEQLIARRLVRDFADLYHLRLEDLVALDGFAEKSATNLVQAIAASRHRGLGRLLHALGIPHVGEHVAMLLAAEFGSLARLGRASAADLAELPGIGPKIAESVVAFLGEENNRLVLERLQRAGVVTTEPRRAGARPLAGRTFVLTGKLKHFTRDTARERIEELGGRVTGSISTHTDYLVVGAFPGRKLDKARRLGVQTIDERALDQMIHERGPD
jgi:DNA ligase (NAD+)